MARTKYEAHNFSPGTLAVVAQAEEICRDFAQQGFDLTLRQLYYQFVSADLIPNTTRSYDRLGRIVTEARLAGYLDWSYIVDRGRDLESRPHWSSPAGVIEAAARSYGRDRWHDQPVRVEVWIEKDALSGVIAPTCDRLDVSYFACKGYTSQSEMYEAGLRLSRYIDAGQRVVILHLGDHDPSGIDMTRDIAKRLDMFTTQNYLNNHNDEFDGDTVATSAIRLRMGMRCGVTTSDMGEGIYVLPHEHAEWETTGALVVDRIALTMAQVEEYEPPPNPAKVTDSRFENYERQYGDESWELDALQPAVLAALINDAVVDLMDDALMTATVDSERAETDHLEAASAAWPAIERFLAERAEQ